MRAHGRILNISSPRHPLIFSKYGLSGMIMRYMRLRSSSEECAHAY